MAGRLIRRLRQYALGPECRHAYEAALTRTFDGQPPPPGNTARIDFDDWFTFQGWNARWPVPQAFALTHPELTPEEVELLRAWTITPRREYRVEAASGDAIRLVDLATGERRMVRQAYHQILPDLRPGEEVLTRVLTAGDDCWFLPDAVFYKTPR